MVVQWYVVMVKVRVTISRVENLCVLEAWIAEARCYFQKKPKVRSGSGKPRMGAGNTECVYVYGDSLNCGRATRTCER